MKGFKKSFNLLLHLLLTYIFFTASASAEISHCGKIRIQQPFLHQSSSYNSHLLTQLILCKSDKLYFRTSIGLFRIQSVDYTDKLITISHNSCSSTSNFVSPHHLSAGFPPPPALLNSLVLFNCSNRSSEIPLGPCNDNTMLSVSCDSERVSSCSVIDDVEKLEKSFDPKGMDCSHYSRVYSSSSDGKVQSGTRISFDIPDHVPNPCDECDKRDGNCGAGLRCACHPKTCKDKVTGAALRVRPSGDMFVYLVFLVVVVVFLYEF